MGNKNVKINKPVKHQIWRFVPSFIGPVLHEIDSAIFLFQQNM